MPRSEDPGLEEVLVKFGWEYTDIFAWEYEHNPWVFNLANALVSTYRLLEEKVNAPQD